MTSFTDTAGRDWPLRITLGLLPKLKAVGVDVGFAPDGVSAVVAAAFRDAEQAGKTLWTLVGPLADERGVTPEQLADAMDGPTIAAAVDAFTGAIVSFTHRPQVVPAVLEKLAATRGLIDATVTAAVAGLDPASILSGSAGSSPASGAGATPATSPTAS